MEARLTLCRPGRLQVCTLHRTEVKSQWLLWLLVSEEGEGPWLCAGYCAPLWQLRKGKRRLARRSRKLGLHTVHVRCQHTAPRLLVPAPAGHLGLAAERRMLRCRLTLVPGLQLLVRSIQTFMGSLLCITNKKGSWRRDQGDMGPHCNLNFLAELGPQEHAQLEQVHGKWILPCGLKGVRQPEAL